MAAASAAVAAADTGAAAGAEVEAPYEAPLCWLSLAGFGAALGTVLCTSRQWSITLSQPSVHASARRPRVCPERQASLFPLLGFDKPNVNLFGRPADLHQISTSPRDIDHSCRIVDIGNSIIQCAHLVIGRHCTYQLRLPSCKVASNTSSANTLLLGLSKPRVRPRIGASGVSKNACLVCTDLQTALQRQSGSSR